MGRTIYTERDIEELATRGIKELNVDENVYITDVAREKMEKLGIKAKTAAGSPVPSAPTNAARMEGTSSPSDRSRLSAAQRLEVVERVKTGVIARLGSSVDTALLDKLVRRVVDEL